MAKVAMPPLVVSLLFLIINTLASSSPGYLQFDIAKGGGGRLSRRQYSTWNAVIDQAIDKSEYLMQIGLGSPPQNLSVTLDTGSSDLWVPTAKNCAENNCDQGQFDPATSGTYEEISQGGFNITYAGPGDSDAGDWGMDLLSIAGSGRLTNIQFGLAQTGTDRHGVIGLGYDTNEAYIPGESTYRSVMDTMVAQKMTQRKAYSIYLNALQESTGSVVFGGIDPTKYTGDLVALPLQKKNGRVSEFFVTLTSVTFTDGHGQIHQLSPEGYAQSVLLDTGTSSSLLSDDVLERIVNGFGAAAYDQYGDLLIPCSYGAQNWTIDYTFGGQDGPTVHVPFSQLIGPQVYSAEHFTDPSGACDFFGFNIVIDDTSILGDSFLRSAYVVFDLDDDVVAIAQARPDDQATNAPGGGVVVIPSGTGLPGVTSTAAASGTMIDGFLRTSAYAAPTAATSGTVVQGGTPTFAVGGEGMGGGGMQPKKSKGNPVVWRTDVALLVWMFICILLIQC